MDILIGYESALEYWRTAGPAFLRDYEQRRMATRRARRVMATQEKPCLVGGSRRPAGCVLPIHVLVASADFRTRTPGLTSHTWSDLPDKSFVGAGENFLVSTPEFMFLQMATKFSLVRLILLALELCGTYVQDAQGPARHRDAPLTSVEKLLAFVSAMPNVRGRKRALQALRYAVDGSASPMESVLAMLLYLPYGMGGYGLPRPQLNYHIDVPHSSQKLADRAYCECDLCWPQVKLAVEYDSKLYHLDAARQESDARRRSTLIALDFTVVTVSFAQIADGGSFNRLSHQLAKLVGKRLRYVDPKFTRAHLALRSELFDAIGMTEAVESAPPRI